MKTVSRLFDWPPVWLVMFAALAWAVSRAWPMADIPVLAMAGRVLIGLGVFLMVAAAGQMILLRTTVIPRQDPSALVTGGVFRLSRNPIYLADALVLLGLVLHWSAWPALVLVPGFAAVITRRFIRGEEARLRAAFGAQFDAFAARTRRWL